MLRFELSGGYLIYQKDVQSNLFLDSIEAQRSEYVTQITIDMSKAGPITPIPNPKWNGTTRRRDPYVNIVSIYIRSKDPFS